MNEKNAYRQEAGQALSDSQAHSNGQVRPDTPGKSKSGNAVQAVSEFAREHPLMMVAGGIAVGLIAGSLLPRGAGRAVARRASSLAEMGAAAAATLGANALEKAETARDSGKEFGRIAFDKAEAARHSGAELGRQALDRAGATASALGKRSEAIAADAIRDLGVLEGIEQLEMVFRERLQWRIGMTLHQMIKVLPIALDGVAGVAPVGRQVLQPLIHGGGKCVHREFRRFRGRDAPVRRKAGSGWRRPVR